MCILTRNIEYTPATHIPSLSTQSKREIAADKVLDDVPEEGHGCSKESWIENHGHVTTVKLGIGRRVTSRAVDVRSGDRAWKPALVSRAGNSSCM